MVFKWIHSDRIVCYQLDDRHTCLMLNVLRLLLIVKIAITVSSFNNRTACVKVVEIVLFFTK